MQIEAYIQASRLILQEGSLSIMKVRPEQDILEQEDLLKLYIVQVLKIGAQLAVKNIGLRG